MMNKAKCTNPNCSRGERPPQFTTTAVVEETWLVDSQGECIRVKDAIVIRGPSAAETWYCAYCDEAVDCVE